MRFIRFNPILYRFGNFNQNPCLFSGFSTLTQNAIIFSFQCQLPQPGVASPFGAGRLRYPCICLAQLQVAPSPSPASRPQPGATAAPLPQPVLVIERLWVHLLPGIHAHGKGKWHFVKKMENFPKWSKFWGYWLSNYLT